jgi:hypothetical protein
MATMQPSFNFLNRLPNELLAVIVRHLTPECSASLGVTCKWLYGVHRRVYGTVPLYTPRYSVYPLQLSQLLRTWIDPNREMVFDTELRKFVTWERWWDILCARFEKDGGWVRSFQWYNVLLWGTVQRIGGYPSECLVPIWIYIFKYLSCPWCRWLTLTFEYQLARINSIHGYDILKSGNKVSVLGEIKQSSPPLQAASRIMLPLCTFKPLARQF